MGRIYKMRTLDNKMTVERTSQLKFDLEMVFFSKKNINFLSSVRHGTSADEFCQLRFYFMGARIQKPTSEINLHTESMNH